MSKFNWKTQYEVEINQAHEARAVSNEGMARVCARRAAGIVIGEYLRRNDQPDLGPSAYDRLQYLVSSPEIPTEAHKCAEYLLLRVTPDHDLPVDVDLISEVEQLKNSLLGFE